MKIRKSYLSIALMALTVQTGMAQEQKRDSLDTGKVYEIGEVVVTGTRNETDVRHLSQTVSVVNRSKIDQALQPSLLPVLTEHRTDSRPVRNLTRSDGLRCVGWRGRKYFTPWIEWRNSPVDGND